jgi:HEAT repeat protein
LTRGARSFNFIAADSKNNLEEKIMIKSSKHSFIGMLALAVLAVSLPVFAGAPLSEDQVVANLASPKESVVISALRNVEKNYPTSTTVLPAVKKLLTDPRLEVKRKAARVLGVIHADVDSTDINNICDLLKSSDKRVIMDGLIALRGLKAQSAIPQIVPLLDNPDLNVKRDSMRTLAVLGDKSLIPKIQPLLTYPYLAVQKYAADAISILKEK